MTIQRLASQIAKREGKKSQARIGDIREILGIMSDIFHEALERGSVDGMDALVKSGAQRAKRAAKKRRIKV